MNVYEVDWGIEPLHDIIVGIEAGLEAIRGRMGDEEGFDGLFAVERAEPVLGLGFVALQNYALSAWTDLNHIRNDYGKPPIDKLDCYRCDLIPTAPGAPRIEAINAIANYFKHQSEWSQSQWPVNETTRTLNRMGITPATEFPCVKATGLLCGEGGKLIVLHQVVREWRRHIFNALR